MGAPDDTVLEQETPLMANQDIKLTASMNGPNKISITGSGGRTLGKGSGAHIFRFELDDQTTHKVKFASLTAADDCSSCPPDTSKPNTQIDQIRIDNSGSKRTARFRDKNDNKPAMDVSYEWHFTCDDPNITVSSFDPIISNGGRV